MMGNATSGNGIVLPPPKYKSTVTASKKRIKSLGEGGKSTALSPTKNCEGQRSTLYTNVTSNIVLTKKFLKGISLFQEVVEGKKTLDLMKDKMVAVEKRAS